MKSYEEGVDLLVQRLLAMRSEWSPTPLRRQCLTIAAQVEALVHVLEMHGSAQARIEEVHDRPPDPTTGLDGWPVPAPDLGTPYKSMVWKLRDLADSARRAGDELPNPRAKPATMFAAKAFVRLRSAGVNYLGCSTTTILAGWARGSCR